MKELVEYLVKSIVDSPQEVLLAEIRDLLKQRA